MTVRQPAGLKVAVTGSGGSLARDVIPGLLQLGHRIVGIDNRRPSEPVAGVELVVCSVSDRAALAEALTGCDAVVHLAGIPLEAPWEDILAVNIDGTQAVFECALRCAVPRVVLASSIHAVGYVAVPPPGAGVPDDVPARPNTFYGVSKAVGEALGSMYHDRYGLDVICLRIASRFPEPRDERMLSTWLSPADAVRLVDAALAVPRPGFRLVWGVSANSAGYLSPHGGEQIGYRPRDNAGEHAGRIRAAAAADPQVAASEWDRCYLGGIFGSPDPPRFVPFAERSERTETQGPSPQPDEQIQQHTHEVTR